MATASLAMIEQIHKDFQLTTKNLEKLGAMSKKTTQSKDWIALFEKVEGAHTPRKPMIENYLIHATKGTNKGLIEFVDEAKYKDERKSLTIRMKLVEKLAKAFSKQAEKDGAEIIIEAVSAAQSELIKKDKKLAQALTMVATGQKGRSGPKQDKLEEYSHIHIGGNAKYNLLFRPGSKLVLGTIDFHIDKTNSESEKAKVRKVASRSGGKVTLKVIGDTISK